MYKGIGATNSPPSHSRWPAERGEETVKVEREPANKPETLPEGTFDEPIATEPTPLPIATRRVSSTSATTSPEEKSREAAMQREISYPALSYLFEIMIKNRFPVTQWEQLGKALGLESHILPNFKCRYPLDYRYIPVIAEWYTKGGTVKCGPTSPDEFLKALETVDPQCAVTIRREWCLDPHDSDSTPSSVANDMYVSLNKMPLDRPLTQSHLAQLEEQLRKNNFFVTKWFILGVALGLNVSALESIFSSTVDGEKCVREVLKKWIDGEDYTHMRGAATIQRLCQALKVIGDAACAENLEQKFAQNTIDESYSNPDIKRVWQRVPWKKTRDVIEENHIPFILDMLEYLEMDNDSIFSLFLNLELFYPDIKPVTDQHTGRLCVTKLLEKWIKQKADGATAGKIYRAVNALSAQKGKKYRAAIEAGGFHKQIAGQESTKELEPMVGGASGELQDKVLTELFISIQQDQTLPSVYKWRQLGQKLGLSDIQLSEIGEDNPEDSRIFLVIWWWVRTFASRPGSCTPTQKNLVNAVEESWGPIYGKRLEDHFQSILQRVDKPPSLAADTEPELSFDQLTLNSPLRREHLGKLLALLKKDCMLGESQWFSLGILMRLKVETLRTIGTSYYRNPQKYFGQVLEYWLQGMDDSLKAGLPTPALLVDILQSHRNGAAAERLKAHFKQRPEK
ncbi:death domain-containing protein [Sansalvadorimonas sp. 2012CJ34-2]|uniref:Death domain-containing protein n=1 Tax=Parendozoicomonas callyspongiae TaxID=2942213 RepID=A0ABT0PHG4_9GAMM|nr:death domain-containing protein [Sansalvadorimonas sp. 2012CJ34-2]MCL6270446.1 death domain-containing protein [Sansalvadorimonas sp. 2012CJ34-2]